MPKGLQTPFQRGHDVQYGLEVTERDSSRRVLGVSCRFCVKFGREAKPGAKRKRTTNVQVFRRPFRTDMYKKHHSSAHPEMWSRFMGCSSEEKATFFDGQVNYASTLMAHFEGEGALTLTFNRDVVDVIIGDLLFDPDDESTQATRERALAVFKPLEDAAVAVDDDEAQDLNLEAYRVKISSVRRFRMVLGFIAGGASFRSASRFVGVAREICKAGYLTGCSEGVCATYARIICACSYQAMFEILRDCWGYSIALDVGHAQGTSYLDLRVRLCTKHGKLANVHVIAIPLLLNKTAETQFNLCSKVLDVIDPMWRSKLIAISTDGERTMTGHRSGVQTRFEEAAEHPIVRVWCGLHQVDLVAQREYVALSDDTFVSTLTGLIAYLRRQQNLQMEMKTTCPKFVSTRWLSMKRVTSWLKTHRVRVIEYLDAKKPACTPTIDWWIVLLCLDSVATVLSSTVTRLQGLSTLLSQQDAELKKLCANLSEMCKVEGPLPAAQLEAVDSATALTRGEFLVTFVHATDFIRDQGTFVIDSLAAMQPERSAAITQSVANLFAGLYAGVMAVVATRDSNNRSSLDVLPPVLPHNLATIRTNELCEIIRPHRVRLEQAGWTTAQVDQIEEDHRELRRAVSSESQFKASLCECSDSTTSFMEGWALCRNRFDKLQLFSGGLASMFPNTATVESDFSVIGVEKNVYRESLTDFSLEGILHAKQFNSLRSLSTE
jgi:hypothetical protein